ncbi:hypothetical protein AVEN_192242-1 [Araneus ventricosus]|uniref:Uncharacterized protein n=1 Tax=Araneus ventricosus TaxID=182803 RepID=A0A4Y2VKR2_ARAVE|nr:hypothetical protein AVEN_174432-1 [Araneus ventricosus]GBO25021.1 hypothetical protein AVEN_179777-1 [Araneus ventricosus]GBO25064.1 hypothetical protein AVEN_80370-1 [Araneus ventricosus]GBO25082.1 hypothetical protein AVEN_192242-1 [Araneus ventricosus]
MNILLLIITEEMREVAEELGLLVNLLMQFAGVRKLVLKTNEVYAFDRFQKIIKDREIKSEKDFYLRATIQDLRELVEEMELQVDLKLPRNALQELILKEDKVYAFGKIPWIIDDRQKMKRGKRELEESMEKPKFEREIGPKQLNLVIKTESDVGKNRSSITRTVK